MESTQLYKEMEANMQYLSARLDKLELLTDQSGGDGGPADATISDPSALVLPMRRFLERTSSILSSRSGSSRRALRTERPTPGDSLPFLSAFNAKSEDRSTGNISDTIGRGPARRRKSTAPASTFTQNIPESPIDESESAMKIEEHPYSTRIQVTGKCAVEPS